MQLRVLLGGEDARLPGVARALESHGAACEFAPDTDALITAALIGDFDLILLDPRLPCAGVLAPCDLLCQMGVGAYIARLVVSGGGVGAPLDADDASLRVPIDGEELAALLGRVHKQKQSARNGRLDALFAQECADLAGDFRAALPRTLDALDAAAAAGSFGELQSLVHRLKGVAGSFGFPEITAPCAAIEAQLRSGLTDAPARATLAMTAAVRNTRLGAVECQTDTSHG